MQLLSNSKNVNTILVVSAIVGALGGLAAFLKYQSDKKKEPLNADVLKLEHELKLLQIEKAKADLGRA